MDRMVRMILRMFLGRGMRAAMTEWDRRQAQKPGGDGRGKPDPAQARTAKESSKNARQAMRVMRRMGRF